MPSDDQTTTKDLPPGLKEVTIPPVTEIMEAIYWPGEGYGGGTRCATMDAAREHVRRSIAMGYGKAGKNPVRIIVTTRQVIEFTVDPWPEKPTAPEPPKRGRKAK